MQRYGWSLSALVSFGVALVLGLGAVGASAEATITEKHMAEHGDGYDINLAYPELGVPRADAAIAEFVQADFSGFKDWASLRTPQEPPYSAQLTYTVARNDESVVSILFSYAFYTGGAHGNLTQTAFNFLMPDGARVFLPELVGSDGVQRVSDMAIGSLDAQLVGPNGMSDPNWIKTGAGPYPENFETFEWLPDEVVLEFDPYQVAAFAAGPQEVRIPLSQLQDLLRPDPRAPLPSFDCALAETSVEHAICSDMPLAQLDRRTAEAFNMRLRFEAEGAQPPIVRAQQRAWLTQRDAACATPSVPDLVSCLSDQYKQRLETLRSFS